MDYVIVYYENLLQKFGKGKEWCIIIIIFENIEVIEVVAKNVKLYVDWKEGFFGMGLKKDEFVCECLDIVDIIVF